MRWGQGPTRISRGDVCSVIQVQTLEQKRHDDDDEDQRADAEGYIASHDFSPK